MNTPRTDAEVTLTFAADHNTVCPNFSRKLEREVTALTAERDQLRTQVEQTRNLLVAALRSAGYQEKRACRAEAELATEYSRNRIAAYQNHEHTDTN